MQAWMIRHKRDGHLYVGQNQDHSGIHAFIPNDRPWYATDEYPHVFFDDQEVVDALNDMDVPDDWQVVEVEITEK